MSETKEDAASKEEAPKEAESETKEDAASSKDDTPPKEEEEAPKEVEKPTPKEEEKPTPMEEEEPPKEAETPAPKEEEEAPKEAETTTPGSRSRRVRKQVEAFQPTEETTKTVEIPKGKGTPLKDMPNVVAHFSEVTWSNPHLKTLYNLVFGVGQRKNFKKNLLEFSGLPEGDKKAAEKVEAKVLKLQMPQLKGILDLIDVERGAESFEEKKNPTHQMLCERLVGWLEEPVESGRNKRKLKGAATKPVSKKKETKKKTEPKKRKAAPPAKKKSSPTKKKKEEKKKEIVIDIPGTTVDQLRTKVKSIISGADKEKMTVKVVRKQLEDWLDVDDLSEHRDSIRMLVMEAMEQE